MSSLALAIPLILVSVLGLLLNSYILFIVLVTKQPQNANNILLLHLGVVDSLLSLTFLVFSAPEMLRGWTLLGLGAPCSIHGFLFTLLHPVALWTVCGLNCDRYYAITAPLHYGTLVNVRKVAVGLGLTWCLSLVLCLPPLFKVAPYKHNPGLSGCAPDFAQDIGALWYSIAYISLTWLVPTVLILGCNFRVLTIARYHRHRIASAIFEVTISAQVTITHQRNPFVVPTGNIFRGRSAVSTVLQLVISFLVLYCPYYAAIICDSSLSTLLPSWRVHPLVFTVASSLLTCSSPINGLLYGVKSKVLRETFKNFWRKQMSRCEVTNEIQARTPSTCGSRRPSVNTPLPRPSSVQLSRRLSESVEARPQMQRISSELTWKTGLFEQESLRRTASCLEAGGSSLHPPVSTIDIPNFRVFRVAMSRSKHSSNPNLTGTNLFLQRVFGVQQQQNKRAAAIQTVLATPTPRSPRILITRVFSEETESSPPTSQNKADCITKAYSSSSTLLDRKWKKLRYQEADNCGSEISEISVKTESESLILTGSKLESGGNNIEDDADSSSSTSDEEHSSGNIYFPFDENEDSPLNASRRSTKEGIQLTHSTPILLQRETETGQSDNRSYEGLWMGPCERSNELVNESQNDTVNLDEYEMCRRFYDGSTFPCILSWPVRRKSSESCRVNLTKSATDLVGGTAEFQL